MAAGFQPVSLGRRILRAVTAPLVALSLIASVLE
ncbi:MAG TPA: 16S rRNA (uracil(1498)-N(3))-methyltransferase [Coleofasciculaceae cyanobacterium]